MIYRVLKGVGTKIIYGLANLSPRDHQKAILGSYKNRLCDNTKYLYLHWQQTQFIRSIWISGNRELINTLNKQGMEAYYRWSLLGIYHALTAKFFFYNSYIGDINQYFANGAIKINLWHGSPMKKIEFDIINGPLSKVFLPQDNQSPRFHSVLHHQQYIRPDLMLSPSPLTDNIFSSAFRLSHQALLRSGNPRTDFHARYPEQKKSKQAIFNMIDIAFTSKSQIILYTPSWRDNHTNINPYQQAFHWRTLSKHLLKTQSIFLLRLHPNEAHLAQKFENHSNVIDISQWEDVYPILHSVDLLITDYSSLFIDALQYQTPIIFYRFDKEEYQEQCRNNYDYVEALSEVGPEYHTFDELLSAIEQGGEEVSHTEQNAFICCEPYKEAYQEAYLHFWEPNNKDAFTHIEEFIIRSQPSLIKTP
ncbi:CDP-glycerol glycerophosphotransferase family protein [Shewanella surugensis]|uniref:CDP-glycerol glycerophosphotransferase family protein n=1 Tax=Shewanella surugensis TaxID=212020 RepID=A0ABT0LC27_9GAMM|nr:CDP-glycerol glycerophosphotransferase family protein [Shewanella surugensis]MCL1124902.1 CDP-glycerol glycerophosphotransferase family protein [Shewanella surugensis]